MERAKLMAIEDEIRATNELIQKLVQRCTILQKIQSGEILTPAERTAQRAKADALKVEADAMPRG